MNSPRRSAYSLFDRLLNRIEVTTPSDRLILRTLFFVIVFSGIWLVFDINKNFSTETPIEGGVFKEGIVGTPRFINPALATTRADQDITALVYSGLMKINPQGELVPDLAESITVSEDGLTYNIIVRKDVHFHDGTPLTARDVIYTIQLIQNPDLKSPLRGNWTNVVIEEVGEYEFNVVLEEPYAPFIENFTFGILPAHLWNSLPTEQIPFSTLNTEPIGSGPFKMDKVIRNESGLIESYLLTKNTDTENPAKINTFETHFYSDEAALISALKRGEVNGSAYVSNENVSDLTQAGNFKLVSEPLPRVFGIFFNQNKSAALRDAAVREALTVAIDREALIEKSLFGQGVPIYAPVAMSADTLESKDGLKDTASSTRVEQAQRILSNAGWIKNNLGLLEKQIDGSAETLSITLKTSNVPLFDNISQTIADEWKAIGVEVVTEQFEQTGLIQSVIRPRDFQALLFGLDMSRSEDLYPFWHSSQKDDPGLNIAQYTNLSVDTLLETARKDQDKNSRQNILREASIIIEKERPAVFLFEPMMTYVVDKNVIVSEINNVGKPSDRFSNVSHWYTDSDTLWNIFKENNN